jgi:drug/metabolite transporter (DMT)-like permease
MKYKIYFILPGFAILTGATFPIAKYAVEYFSAVDAAAWRFGFAAFAMFLLLVAKEKVNIDVVKRNMIIYILLGVIGVFGFNFLFFLGMKYTSPVNGALIMATNPLVTTLLSWLILQESISRRQGIGVIFALIGVSLVITQGSWTMIRDLSFSRGDIFVFLGNICWALYGILSRRFLQNSSSLQTTTYTMIIGSIGLLIAASFTPNPIPLVHIPTETWAAIAFMAFGTSVLGYLWWNQGIAEIGASKTSLFFNLVPVVTMLISFLSGIPVMFVQVLGVILVLTGVLIASEVIALKWKQNKAIAQDMEK